MPSVQVKSDVDVTALGLLYIGTYIRMYLGEKLQVVRISTTNFFCLLQNCLVTENELPIEDI